MTFLPVSKNARDVGVCIYCGSSQGPLTTEHAIPYGMNGSWTLLRASCSECADVTHRFERDTLQGLLPHIRTVLEMRSRRRRQRTKTPPLLVSSGGISQNIQVPTADFPLYLFTPIFPVPGYVSGKPPVSGISAKLEHLHIAGPTFKEFCQKNGLDSAHAQLSFVPEYFARTLAKIAFCAGVYVLGLAPFKQTPIRDVIFGKDPYVGHWVGCWTGEPINETKGVHALQVRASGSDIHVIVRLFAQYGAPEYHVVLGPAEPDFASSDAWPWKD